MRIVLTDPNRAGYWAPFFKSSFLDQKRFSCTILGWAIWQNISKKKSHDRSFILSLFMETFVYNWGKLQAFCLCSKKKQQITIKQCSFQVFGIVRLSYRPPLHNYITEFHQNWFFSECNAITCWKDVRFFISTIRECKNVTVQSCPALYTFKIPFICTMRFESFLPFIASIL